MKCRCLIPIDTSKRCRNNILYLGLLSREEQEEWCKTYKKDISKYKVCDGNLQAHVEAVDEPYYGGTCAELLVYFTCDNCYSNHHPYLPNKDNIEEFITRVVGKI